jgi:LuxR family maltose regulon positive regulatory protein
MNTHILATKLHIPPWRDTGVPRPRLVEKLNDGLRPTNKLLLISAPVGYGKTSLVSEWCQILDDKTWLGWLSLDKPDNEPERFMVYWLSAFQKLNESIHEKIRAVLSLPQLPPFQFIQEELLNELAGLDFPVVMILDDFHIIDHPQILETLEYFLEYLPAHVHLVISTRQDPHLPLARLRARSQVIEVRGQDLRFTSEEARHFLHDSMQLDLTEESADALEKRTEGWAVGLQLAGLALQNINDKQKFIETFSGNHRFVFDFLAEEVMHQLGEELCAFLSQISILDRFNADLCRALTGRTDVQTVIAHLEQANLFIIPLDDERVWYRYHHLFSDYLQMLLPQENLGELYKKASHWHETNGLIEEAVQYAQLSQDPDFAADVISRALENDATWSRGDINLLISWLEALSPETLSHRPVLSLNAAYTFFLSGQFELSGKQIGIAQKSLKSMPETPEIIQMQAVAALYRGSIDAVRGDFSKAVEQINYAKSKLDPENDLVLARASFSLGLAYEIANQVDQAVENYLAASKQAQTAGVLLLAIHALCAAAQVQIKQGRLAQAKRTSEEAVRLAKEQQIPPLGLARIVLGVIAYEQNHLDEAHQFLKEGVKLAQEGGLMDDVILGLSYLTRFHLAQGRPDAAFEVCQKFSKLIRAFGIPRMTLISEAFQARLQLCVGQEKAAENWAEKYQQTRETLQQEFADLILARVLLSTGKPDTVPDILAPLLDCAASAGHIQTRIEIMILMGLFYQVKNNLSAAEDWIGKALRLAEPEGFVRIFLDEGKPLFNLLQRARSYAPDFSDRLLEANQPQIVERSSAIERLPDPLSEQEMRILQLIIAGKSNKEIAEGLFITVGTAKWHVHNILQKLGVSRRSQAIARARELGLD